MKQLNRKSPAGAAVMGHGVVGSGTAEILLKNKKFIEKGAERPLELLRILDLRDFPDCPYHNLFTKRFEDILEDDRIEVVAEVMGGVEPAFTFTKKLLEAGKSVVTSNKELVAKKGSELLETARRHHVNYLFEASVGGGIPIIHPLHRCLAANRIESVCGIVNGTTNFILTAMIRNGMRFEDALRIAQEKGYAEKDPTADIEGIDAARKLCILASIAFGKHIAPEDVPVKGITGVTLCDVENAEKIGRVIKLIVQAKQDENGTVTLWTAPAMIPAESRLGTVEDVFNAILIKGSEVGDVCFWGRGAGKLPTASAVVSDMIEAAYSRDTVSSLGWSGETAPLAADPEGENRFCLSVGKTAAMPELLKAVCPDAEYPFGEKEDAVSLLTPPLTAPALLSLRNKIEEKGGKILSEIRLFDCE